MLSGWIDAGGAAQAAIDAIIAESAASPIAEFDDDTYIDYRARRPVMELREGLSEARAEQDLDRVGKLADKVSGMQRETNAEMAKAFEDLSAGGDAKAVASLLGRLRYYRRFLDEVEVIEEEALG